VGAVIGGYTTRDVAKLLGFSEAQVRGFVRAGFIAPRRGVHREFRFSLQDMVLLRAAKALRETVPPRRMRRALRRLQEQLPAGRPLSAVRITAEGDQVVVRDGSSSWEPASGQLVLDFEVAELASKVEPLARRAAQEARSDETNLDGEDWYRLGCDLEPHDADQARDAYRRALELDPGHVDALINLGRLLHEAGHPDAAEQHYRRALELRPADATAAFNRGVALEDLGRWEQAIDCYERALGADPKLQEAHFNLARLFERLGRRAAAIRHLKAYRSLTRE
jgi:tetratricopeptide (TPR) repeat protein